MPESFHDLVSKLIVDTKGSPDPSFLAITQDSSIWAILPELILCATIVVILLLRVIRVGHKLDDVLGRTVGCSLSFLLTLAGSLLAVWFAAPWMHLGAAPGAEAISDPGTVTRMEIFTGMLVYDTFGVYVRSLLLLFLVLFAVFTQLSGIPDREDGPDIYTLVLGATLGMCLMATANHLMMVFLAVEMASVPSYALAGLLKGRKVSSEAALKYSVYGAGAAGVMLYGISLIAGLLNTAHLPTMAAELAHRLPEFSAEPGQWVVLALGGLMIMVGLAFKLSAVPFHFWCPDVFEGATAEVNAFLSVASKAAALALLVRVAVGFGFVPSPADGSKFFEPGARTAMKVAEEETVAVKAETPATPESRTYLVSIEGDSDPAPEAESASDVKPAAPEPKTAETNMLAALAPVRDFIGKLVAFFAVITCTFGNLAAYGQTNIKRLMAYSTIAHAGYMMMPIPVVMSLADVDPQVARDAVAALCIYMGIYLFMNLGAFAIIAFLRNAMRSEEIADYGGLIWRCPSVVICFSIILFSLLGMPPLAGFIGKFAIFASLADGYQLTLSTGQPATYLLVLLLVGGANTAISLFYYLRVVKVMTLDPEPQDRRPFSLSGVSLPGFYVVFVSGMMLVLFFFWNGLNEAAQAAARYLLT